MYFFSVVELGVVRVFVAVVVGYWWEWWLSGDGDGVGGDCGDRLC